MGNDRKQAKLLLINTTILNAHAAISGFSARYSNYRSNVYPGAWECRDIKTGDREIQLQLIDRMYEPRRGIKTSESPIVHILLASHGNDVVLKYQLKQQMSVSIMCLLYWGVALSVLLVSFGAFSAQRIAAGMIALFCSACLFGIAVTWLVRNYKHNSLIIGVLEEILNKNFECSSMKGF